MQLSLRCRRRRRQRRQRQRRRRRRHRQSWQRSLSERVGIHVHGCVCMCVFMCACFDCLRECVGGAKNNKIKNTKIVGDDFRSLDKPPLQKQQEQQLIAKSKCNK